MGSELQWNPSTKHALHYYYSLLILNNIDLWHSENGSLVQATCKCWCAKYQKVKTLWWGLLGLLILSVVPDRQLWETVNTDCSFSLAFISRQIYLNLCFSWGFHYSSSNSSNMEQISHETILYWEVSTTLAILIQYNTVTVTLRSQKHFETLFALK